MRPPQPKNSTSSPMSRYTEPSAEGAGSVSGKISSESGPPLTGVYVSLCEESEFGQCYPITTESAGGYSFSEVPAGRYLVTASPPINSGYGRVNSEFLRGGGTHRNRESRAARSGLRDGRGNRTEEQSGGLRERPSVPMKRASSLKPTGSASTQSKESGMVNTSQPWLLRSRTTARLRPSSASPAWPPAP